MTFDNGTIGELVKLDGLGAALYDALAGRPPFDDDSVVKLLFKVIHEAPPPLRRHDSRLPEALELMTGKCLNKEPAQRYATAQARADDLERFLADYLKPCAVNEDCIRADEPQQTAYAAVLGARSSTGVDLSIDLIDGLGQVAEQLATMFECWVGQIRGIWSSRNSLAQSFDGHGRGHLTRLVSAHSIGDRKYAEITIDQERFLVALSDSPHITRSGRRELELRHIPNILYSISWSRGAAEGCGTYWRKDHHVVSAPGNRGHLGRSLFVDEARMPVAQAATGSRGATDSACTLCSGLESVRHVAGLRRADNFSVALLRIMVR